MQWFALVIVAAAVATAVTLFLRTRQRGPTPPIQKNPYHCVSIEHGWYACGAAVQVKDIRYLSKEAPTLPLRECNFENCQCRYEHFPDRRVEERRGLFGSAASNDGNRRRRDRRQRPHRYAF